MFSSVRNYDKLNDPGHVLREVDRPDCCTGLSSTLDLRHLKYERDEQVNNRTNINQTIKPKDNCPQK